MLINVNVSVPTPNGPNIGVQVDANDFADALEKAKDPILKSAQASAAVLMAGLPADRRPNPPAAPAAT